MIYLHHDGFFFLFTFVHMYTPPVSLKVLVRKPRRQFDDLGWTKTETLCESGGEEKGAQFFFFFQFPIQLKFLHFCWALTAWFFLLTISLPICLFARRWDERTNGREVFLGERKAYCVNAIFYWISLTITSATRGIFAYLELNLVFLSFPDLHPDYCFYLILYLY